jgi:hypothetical protein
MLDKKYAIQILHNNEWIWLTYPTYPSSPENRALTTFNNLDEAEQEANRWTAKFQKTRVVKLDNEP